ncbi:hypothetical protein DPEC_G00025390 [Dallia pectoralis]|uniref:Uncharacterized protein n=1 Tax=Dallia pectoralis TaxID=75939 RepID=A0ACC2HHQ4_DALPE|nr:hypothetical protein DPEC_G00025390 [Dallia pectoralis]
MHPQKRFISALFVFCALWTNAWSVTRYSILEEMERGSVVANLPADLGLELAELAHRECQKPKPSKAAPPSRNSVLSERNSTIADSTLVSNDAYWYSMFLAETRKGKLVVRQPVPKAGSRYIVSSLPRSTGLTETSDSAASTLQCQKPKHSKAAPPSRNSVLSERNSTIADSTLVSNDAYWYSMFLAETRKGKLVVRQPVPKAGSRYIVSSLPRSTGLTETSDSAASTLQCQTSKPSKAAPPSRNSVLSERNSTIADSTLVSNDAYWYSMFLAETRKGKLVVRQPVPKAGSRYIVSSLPRSTGLTETSDSAASTLQCQKPKPCKAAPPSRNSVLSERNSTIADSTLVSNDAYWYSMFLAETRKGKLVVRQPVPKAGSRYIVSSLPRSTGLTETSDSAASTLQCQKPKPSKAAPPSRNSVLSERNSTIADSTLVSNDAYWYSMFLAETRKGKLVVRQPVPKAGSRYIVSSLPRSTGLTETSDSAASTLQCQKPRPSKAAPPSRNSVLSERNSTIADSTLVSNDAYWYSMFLAETRKGKLVVRQPVPKAGSRYIVSSLPRSTGLTETSDSAASTLQCQKPKPSKAAPPSRNSVLSERNSTIADSTLVSNDAYWYSMFLAETRKGKLVVRQPVPKAGSRYIVSSLPRSTGLTETSDSAASTLQCQKPKHSKAAPPSRNSVLSERNSTIADSTLVSNDAYWYIYQEARALQKPVTQQPLHCSILSEGRPLCGWRDPPPPAAVPRKASSPLVHIRRNPVFS